MTDTVSLDFLDAWIDYKIKMWTGREIAPEHLLKLLRDDIRAFRAIPAARQVLDA